MIYLFSNFLFYTPETPDTTLPSPGKPLSMPNIFFMILQLKSYRFPRLSTFLIDKYRQTMMYLLD